MAAGGGWVAMEFEAALAEDGIAVVRSGVTRDEFFALAASLGTIISELAVFVDPAQTQYVRNPASVPFHTDHHPLVDVIGWYCVRPCQSGAPNVFLDARDAYDRLSPSDRERLRGARLRLKSEGRIPVLSFDRGRPRFAWNSVWLEPPGDPDTERAVRRFAELLDGEHGVRTITVPLQADELVLIDNRRFLHGRPPLPADSRRLLYRLWISADPRAAQFQVDRPTAMEVLRKRPAGIG
jgi:alpha-ketoglutarate-dependent taurine dioxygenase